MPLEIRQHECDDFDVTKFDGKWAAASLYYWNWIWGFDTEEDARTVADALATVEEHVLDAATSR